MRNDETVGMTIRFPDGPDAQTRTQEWLEWLDHGEMFGGLVLERVKPVDPGWVDLVVVGVPREEAEA